MALEYLLSKLVPPFSKIVKANLDYIKAYYSLGIVPFKPSNEDEEPKIVAIESGPRLRYWRFQRAVCFVKTVYMCATFLSSLFVPDLQDPAHIPLHFSLCVICVEVCIWGYGNLAAYSETVVAVFNETIKHRTAVKGRSIQQYFAYNIPPSVVLLLLVEAVLFALDDSMLMQFKFFVKYFELQPLSIGPLLTWSLWALEVYATCTITLVVIFMLQTHMLFIEIWPKYLGQMALKCKARNNWNSKEAMKLHSEIRKSQLLLCYFNDLNAFPVLFMKIYSLGSSIIAWSTVILKGYSNAAAGITNTYIGVVSLLFFPVAYQWAYKIPSSVTALKLESIRLSKYLDSEDRGFAQKLAASVRSDGIHAGPFRTIERESTLLYLDFFTSNLASLLISKR